MEIGSDEQWMSQAIALARLGRGETEPNPSVGCVLVKDGVEVGRGRTQPPGGMHAEPSALADCAARGNDPRGSTAYVTLEPCCHTNKRTPPCVPALIGAGVRRVVVGCLDPNPEVNGEGVRQLRAAGVEVVTGVLEGQAKQLIAPFIARTVLGRPYVTLKWAESADGFIAGLGGERRQISGEASMRVVHRLRARMDAILVGGETVRRDDPLLTVRGEGSGETDQGSEGTGGVPQMVSREGLGEVRRVLLRGVVTAGGKLPVKARLFASVSEGPVVVYAGSGGRGDGRSAMELREELPRGVEVVEGAELASVLADLARRGVTHVLVESGGRLADALWKAGLADRAWVFRSRVAFGEGVKAMKLEGAEAGRTQVGADELVELLNPHSRVMFAAVASADFEQLTA